MPVFQEKDPGFLGSYNLSYLLRRQKHEFINFIAPTATTLGDRMQVGR